MRVANVMRAFHASTASGALPYVSGAGDSLGQAPQHAPSVFNFFSPSYTVAGGPAEHGLVAPEFQITTESTTISSANVMNTLVYSGLNGLNGKTTLDLSALTSLSNSPASITAYLNNLLMAGQMSAAMQNTLTTTIGAIPSSNPTERAESALQIVATSPEFVIQK